MRVHAHGGGVPDGRCAGERMITTTDPVGDRVPRAIESAVCAGVTVHDVGRVSASIFMRYFGPQLRPLIEDNSVRSSASTIFNAKVEYRLCESVGPDCGRVHTIIVYAARPTMASVSSRIFFSFSAFMVGPRRRRCS